MKRENNLDVLRVIACIFVIILHVSAPYVTKNMENPTLYFTIGNFFDSMVRTCVPIFVLLGGAFALSNPKNLNFKYYYKKQFKHIIIPLLIWSFIYIVYSYIIQIGGYYILKTPMEYLKPLKNLILGRPFYHLWYMYMLIGLIGVTPILLIIKKEIGEKNFFKLGISLLVLSVPISFFSKLYWMIQFIIYLGYYILGYSIKNNNKTKVHKFLLLLGFLLSGISVFLLTEFIVRNNLFNKSLYFYGNLSPFVITGSLFLYFYFLNIRIKKNINIFENLSNHSLNIYLIHAGILHSIGLLFKILKFPEFNPIIYIPVMTIFIFITSYSISILLKKLNC